MHRSVALLLCCLLAPVAAACTDAGGGTVVSAADPGVTQLPLPDNDLIYVGTDTGIAALNPDSGVVEFNVPNAVASGDWSRLWRTTLLTRSTGLRPVDPATGADVGEQLGLDGSLVVRLASQDGSSVALMPMRTSGIDPYLPEPRAHTSITVARPDAGKVQTYELDGNFEPEAFSIDSESLFVIKYLPATAPDRYQVRRLDLDTGEDLETFDLDKKIQPEMGGVARTHVRAPDGRRLYTLYTRADSGTSFVHILSLEDKWAHCVDLPVGITGLNGAALTLTITPDGRSLVVADLATGEIAVMDTAALAIVDSANIGASQAGTPASSATDGETLYLGSPAKILAVDLDTLVVDRGWEGPSSLLGITLDDDGHRLYASDGPTLWVYDVRRGEEKARFDQVVVGGMTYIGRDAAPSPVNLAATECAC